MRPRIFWVAIAFSVLTIALSVAAMARASAYSDSENAFLIDAQNNGLVVLNADAMVNWGHLICSDLYEGFSPWSAVRDSVTHNVGFTVRDGRVEVAAAALDLCPSEVPVVLAAGV